MYFLNKGKPPKGGQYLQCDSAKRGLGCSEKMFRYDVLEPMILTYCKGLDAQEILPGNEKRLSELSVLRNQFQATEGELGQVQGQVDNVLDSIAGQPSKKLRKVLEGRADALLAQKVELEAQRAELDGRIETLSNSGQDTEQRLMSIRELIERMGNLEDQDRIDFRLNLRGQLRRLLSKVRVFPDRQSVALFFSTGERRLLTMEAGEVKVLDAYPKKRKVR